MSEARVLIIDADAQRAESLRAIVEFMDYRAVLVDDAAALGSGGQRPQDWLAILVGETQGPAMQNFVEWLKRDRLHPPLLVLQPYHAQALERFALDPSACLSLDTPVRYTALSELLKRASLLRGDAITARMPMQGPTGNSTVIRHVRTLIEQVAGFDTTVLITGESGTGKEVVARAIHARSPRRDQAFVAVNCGAIPAELLESELFGHEKGAFTGAITSRRGRFEMADGGTLFLDEIGDMPLPMQVKILRVLQERSFERVGATRSTPCNVRIIAATHRNLEDAIIRNTFREDLYYRLNVFPIEMPPLRERAEDLPLLIDDLQQSLQRAGHRAARLMPDAVHALRRYHWPGNVRELSNLIERLAVLHPNKTIDAATLPSRYASLSTATEAAGSAAQAEALSAMVAPLDPPALHFDNRTLAGDLACGLAAPALADLPPEGLCLKDHIEAIELALIRQALQQAGGVVAHAAKLLSTRRTTLVEKLRKYGLTRDVSSLELESLAG